MSDHRQHLPHAQPGQQYVPPGQEYAWAQPVDRAEQLNYQYDVLHSAITRMQNLNLGHAELAWKLRRSDPIAAYVLVLLFAQPNPAFVRPGTGPAPVPLLTGGTSSARATQVKATTRIWPAGPENRDLAELLFRLEQHVWDNRDADGWTLRDTLMTSIDPGLHAGDRWAGLAVSSLDTHTGTWAQVRDTATSEANVPGTIRLLVDVAHDGPPDLAWVTGDRRGLNDFGARTLFSTHALSDNDFDSPLRHQRFTTSQLFHDVRHKTIVERMAGLDRALREARYFTHPQGLPGYGSRWRQALQNSHGRTS